MKLPLLALFLAGALSTVAAEQAADLDYRAPLPHPEFAPNAGPRIGIDEAHHNFHTAEGRYQPFAELLRRDGYRVTPFTRTLSAESLQTVDVLVIANPLHADNVKHWSLPTPSAYSTEEIAAVRSWVLAGGALFLIVDHMPFPGAAGPLAEAFGFEFSNGFVTRKGAKHPGPLTFRPGGGLMRCAVTVGRSPEETVDEIMTFTGSAFRPPHDAIVVLALDDRYASLEPITAWRFLPDTPAIRLEGYSQGAIQSVGRGRLAVFGEASMFSAQKTGPTGIPTGMNHPGAKQNHQLLLNIVHWLGSVRTGGGHEPARRDGP